MKRIWKYLFLFVVTWTMRQEVCVGQNLVPNPSFEDTVACPTGPGYVSMAVSWSSFRDTPDYFNACADSASLVSVPNNAFGNRTAYHGNAYCGFQTHSFANDYREIIGCKLVTPLSIGTKYYLKFYISKAPWGPSWAAGAASNKIGARFSTVSYNTSSPAPINNFAHIYTDSIIIDSLNWTLIQGSIIADSAYQYLALGNFFDDANTQLNVLGRAYYFIDVICLTTDNLECQITEGVNEHSKKVEVKIFPNPARDWIAVEESDLKSISIFDIFGNKCIEDAFAITSLHKINVSFLSRGIYFIRVTTSKNIFNQKIILTN